MAGSDEYRHRVLDPTLDNYLAGLPAVTLEGAKGVGKTESAKQRASTIFRLDQPEQREILAADLEQIIRAAPPVLIDEWQRYPPVWDRIRRAVDEAPAPGRFLVTGSADPPGIGRHSGAGRIVGLRLRPFSLAERLADPPTVSLQTLLSGQKPDLEGETSIGLSEYTAEIVASGLPGIRRLPTQVRRVQLDSYLELVVSRDFEELGQQVRNPSALKRWMAAYAAATSTTASFEAIRRAASSNESEAPARSTVLPYRDALERLFLLDPVHPWRPTKSHVARIGDPIKHQLVDPALAARLLGATEETLLAGEAPGPVIARDGSLLGALFEALVTLSARVYAQACDARVGHLRTHSGTHEIDLIIERDDGKVVAIEIKLAATPDSRSVRHLTWLAEVIGDELLDSVVITTGTTAYRRSDGIAVVPAALLGP
ncbi:MAG TPA: DUF4143 domain-containing protein [Solirubrobacteraceae bacterium]|nr:DUF4143 domain-containing protein [Solirubrobacteraceae bacterium]